MLLDKTAVFFVIVRLFLSLWFSGIGINYCKLAQKIIRMMQNQNDPKSRFTNKTRYFDHHFELVALFTDASSSLQPRCSEKRKLVHDTLVHSHRNKSKRF